MPQIDTAFRIATVLMTNPWVIAPPKKTLVVGVADMIAVNDPSAELVTYSLGSCLGVCVYDPVKKLAGLLHLMLPDSAIDRVRASANPYMFVDTGVPRLFHAVYNLGGQRGRLIVKVAGGAEFLDEKRIFNIGQRNTRALSDLLTSHGIPVQGKDVGGRTSRTIRMELATGGVSVHSPGQAPYPL